MVWSGMEGFVESGVTTGVVTGVVTPRELDTSEVEVAECEAEAELVVAGVRGCKSSAEDEV